ncbi:MAG: TolC family protein [Spirochaetia bacterium]
MKTRVFAIALFCLPILYAGPQNQSTVVTLSQCIDTALASGADAKIIQESLQISRELYSASEAADSFSLTGALGYGASYGLGDPGLQTVKSTASGVTSSITQGPQAGVSLAGPLTSMSLLASPYNPSTGSAAASSALGLLVNQTIWDGYVGGKAKAVVQKSFLSLQVKELSAESARASLAYRIKQAYYTMLGAQRNLSVKQQVLDQQNALLNQIKAVYALQQASAVDLKTAQINARSAEIDVQSARHDLGIARIRLANLLGWPRDKEFSVAEADDPTVPVGSAEEAVSQGLSRRPELKEIELNKQSYAIDLTLLRGQAWPTASVSGGVSWAFDWQGANAAIASLGLKIGLPIYDAGDLAHQIEADVLQNDVYALQSAQLRETIATDIQEAYEMVQIQMGKLEVARLSVEKFDLQFKLVQTKLEHGTATNQDVLNASVDSANAQSEMSKAQRDAQLAVLQLQSLMGY